MKMHIPTVNLKLLPIKAHFFFYQGGTAPFTPFLTSISKQRQYSAFLVGIVFSLLPIVAILSRPLFGAMADRYRCQKTMFLWAIVIAIIVNASFSIIPESPTDVDNSDDAIALCTYQFWTFFLFLMCRNITLNILNTLSDTMCLQNLGKDTQKFGKQRLWGCVGWGTVSLITGWLIDWYSNGNLSKDYTPGLVVSIVFLVADLFAVSKINDCQSEVVSTHIFRDIKKVLYDLKVVNFFIWIIFFGIFYGSISLYLLWHLEELVANYHPEMYSSLKTIQGMLIAIKCFGGETPFFFLSSKIIKKIGHLNSIIIGHAALSLRCFLYYIIKNPMWILPVELLSGLGFALPYSAMTAYGSIIAPEGLKGTVQGLVGTVFQGIGSSLGSFITGYLFQKIGSSKTYLILSISALVICIVQTIIILVMAKETRSKTKTNNIEVNTIS